MQSTPTGSAGGARGGATGAAAGATAGRCADGEQAGIASKAVSRTARAVHIWFRFYQGRPDAPAYDDRMGVRWPGCLALLAAGCGGGGERAPDAGSDADPLVLTAGVSWDAQSWDALDLWRYSPPIVRFTPEVDPATLTAESMVVTAGSVTIPHTFEVIDVAGRSDVLLQLDWPDPLLAPTTATITLADSIRGAQGEPFAGHTESWEYGIWHHRDLRWSEDALTPRMAIAADGEPVVAWIQGDKEVLNDSRITVSRLGTGVGLSLPVSFYGTEDFDVLVDAQDRIVVAWVEALVLPGPAGVWHRVIVARQDGSSWEVLADDDDLVSHDPVNDIELVRDGDSWLVAYLRFTSIVLHRWNEAASSWTPVGQLAPPNGAESFDLAVIDGVPVVAYRRNANADGVHVARQDDFAVWTEPPQTLARGLGFTDLDIQVAGGDGELAVTWREADTPGHVYVSTVSVPDLAISRLGGALDVDIEDDARGAALAYAADGSLYAALVETGVRGRQLNVLRYGAGEWQPIGPRADIDTQGGRAPVDLVIDGRGRPVVAYPSGGTDRLVRISRDNGTTVYPTGLTGWSAGGCDFPATPPPLLEDTGCYASIGSRTPATGAIPYGVRASTWSDGDELVRYLFLPAGTALDASGAAFAYPSGTVFLQELRWGGRPLESRFLVKRCDEGACAEPWQGYSYRWIDDDGVLAQPTLVDGAAATTTDWPYVDAIGEPEVHTHLYPARAECMRCHSAAAGRVLGAHPAQLARAYPYDEMIDDQLRTWSAIGALTGTPSATPAPIAHDHSLGFEGQSRAYLHVNCSSCHQPGGEHPALDLRGDTALADTGLCAHITPGNGSGSPLYADMLLPIGALQQDNDARFFVRLWIESMTTCP
jgi:hypothetical protein